jgi:hypothetical protein
MMAVSLYDLSVANYLQTLGGVEGFLGKSLSHFSDSKVNAGDVADSRLAPDMLPFRFQIHAVIRRWKLCKILFCILSKHFGSFSMIHRN